MSLRLNVIQQRCTEPLFFFWLEPPDHSVVHSLLFHISRRIDLHLIPQLAVLIDRGEIRLESVVPGFKGVFFVSRPSPRVLHRWTRGNQSSISQR